MATIAVGREIPGAYTPARGTERRPSLWNGATPEVFFAKRIDNSRLVRFADPRRAREIRIMAIAASIFFAVFLIYSWQHFRAIEYGYKIEAQRVQRDRLAEDNAKLSLQQAQLRDPERIDALAKKMGLVAPHAGQVIPFEEQADPGQPVYAKVMPTGNLSGR